MKIALLTDGIYPFVLGGMQRHSYFLLKSLLANGHQVVLFHYIPEGAEKESFSSYFSEKERKAMEVRVVPFPKKDPFPGHYLRESYAYSLKIHDELKPLFPEIDLIIAKGFSAWKILEEKKKGGSFPPIAVKFHGYEMFQKAPSFRVKLAHYLLRRPVLYNTLNADEVFSYGGRITDIIKKLGVKEERIQVVPAGVDKEKVADSYVPSTGKRKFVFLGRYERRKGVEELGKVVGRLVDEEDFEFHFIGPIPEHKRITSEKVVYHGEVRGAEKIATMIRDKDVLVCPSYSEGMPNVILEAMSQGLAVIATDVGATATLVSEENGWLLSSPALHPLKNAIIEAIQSSPEAIGQKKQLSLEKIHNHFTWDQIGIVLESAVQEMVKDHERPLF